MKLTPFSIDLKNDQSALVREVTPEDRALLQIGYGHLSNRSRYFRFLATRHGLTTVELDIFTANNGADHVAVGALMEGQLTPEPIGIARYIRLPDQKHRAEIAITIVDSYQRQGLGSLLLGVIAKFASLNKISQFDALVHNENTAMLGMFRQLGSRQTKSEGLETEVKIPVFRDPNQYPPSSVGNTFKRVYRLTIID